MRVRPALLCLAAALLLASAAGAGPKGWWDRDFTHRKRIVLSERQAWPEADAAHVLLATGGRAAPDGRDIRVVTTDGNPVPTGIAAAGPGDLFEVVFPVQGRTEWHVYYGNPKAEAPKDAFVPSTGLVLETRERGAGTPDDWAGIQRILERSTRVFGGRYWTQVFDAENPFGPSDDYVSDYRGHILCPADGNYTFYTASDEASFLLIDDVVVASWPGWHNAQRGAWAEFKGTVNLTAGLHRFRYVHVERTGAQVAAAYWLPPGEEKPAVIRPQFFPGLRVAETVRQEVLGRDLAADFDASERDKWGLDDMVFTAMGFAAQLGPEGTSYEWDFGDGTTGEGPIAYHVYLSGGEYAAALTVRRGEETDTVIRTIRVQDEWTRSDRNREEVFARFTRMVAAYPGLRLAGRDLLKLEFLLAETGRMRDLARILDEALQPRSGLTDPERYLAATRLGAMERDRFRDRDAATAAFRRAAAVSTGRERAEAQVRGAEALLVLGGDAATALRLLAQVAEDREVGEGDAALRAWLRIGDAKMLLGDGAGAKEAYARALELAGGAEDPKRILRRAGATRAALTHLETGERERVLESLAEWEWSDPMERYTGLHRIASAKALVLRGEADLAVRELEGLLRGNAESEYGDQALFLLAGIEDDRGNPARATEHRTRLKERYPWSPLNR